MKYLLNIFLVFSCVFMSFAVVNTNVITTTEVSCVNINGISFQLEEKKQDLLVKKISKSPLGDVSKIKTQMLKVMDFSIPEEIAIVQSLKSDYFNGPQFTYQCPYEHLLLINIFRPPVFSI